jgi:hypothetical protein
MLEFVRREIDMERLIQKGSRIIAFAAFLFVLVLVEPVHGQTFDPLGRTVLPQGRGVVAPQGGTLNSLGIGPTFRGQSYQGPQIQPRLQTPQAFQGLQRQRFSPLNQNLIQPSNYPVGPAFTRAPKASPCGNSQCNDPTCSGGCQNSQPKKQHFIPRLDGKKTPGQMGQLIMTPSRIVAPVGSEVVVLAGICGGDGYFVKNQPLEWMLSNDSVGQIIEVGGMHHPTFNKVVSPTAKKFDGQYAHGRTGLKPLMLTRGTPTPVDDIQLLEGQTFLSLSSESPGTTWITGVAPAAEAWDRRRSSTRIHWVDGNWAIPVPISATAGTVSPLSTVVTRSDGSAGVEGWKVRYSIVGGAPAEFAPAGSQTAEATTNKNGEATVQIRQRAGQFDPGTTQVRVDVVRPAFGSEPELVVESGLTQVAWSAPALTIRAIGPAEAVSDEPFNYRVEVSNPGDQLARNVIVSTKDFDPSLEYISATPKPTQYGSQYQWELGDIAPRSQPRIIDVQLRSKKRGSVGLCFEVASETDRLRTEACAQTEIEGACIGLEIQGPETAMVGDEVTYEIGLINQCEETLKNVQLRITPDAGLVASGRASRIIEGSIGEIPFGEKKTIPVQFQAIQEGRQCFRLDVVADGGHDAGLLECLIVSQTGSSGVRLQIQGGVPIRVGENTLVRAVVTNTGNVPLNSVVIENQFEPSLAATGYTDNVRGPENLGDGEPLLLELGRLEPGDSSIVDIQYQGLAVDGDANMLFTVTSAEEITDSEELSIRVEPDGAGDNRGVDPNRPEFERPDLDRTPRVPNFPGTGSDSGSGIDGGFGPGSEPPIGVPQDSEPLGQSGLGVQIQANQQPISSVRREQAQVRFRVTNNDTEPHDNVNVSVQLPQGLLYSNIDFGDSGMSTANAVFAAVDRVDFTTRRTLRPGESMEATLFVIGNGEGRHPVRILAQSNQTQVLERTDFVNVSR